MSCTRSTNHEGVQLIKPLLHRAAGLQFVPEVGNTLLYRRGITGRIFEHAIPGERTIHRTTRGAGEGDDVMCLVNAMSKQPAKYTGGKCRLAATPLTGDGDSFFTRLIHGVSMSLKADADADGDAIGIG